MTRIGRNDPCPCGSGKKYKHCHLGKELPPDVAASLAPTPAAVAPVGVDGPVSIEDRDDRWDPELDDLSDEELDELLDLEPERTPAEALADEAWDAKRRWKRLQLARQAIALDPDCMEAYLVLAHDATTHGKDPLEFLDQAIASGERYLTPEGKSASLTHGDLWANPASEPYRRALFLKAEALGDRGRNEDAIALLRDLIRLDAHDEVLGHVQLLPLLLREGLDDEADELAERFRDEANFEWQLANALRQFRRTGETIFARRALARAVIHQPVLVPYFTGKKKMPRTRPIDDDLDSMFNAEFVAAMAAWGQLTLWQETPGALDWFHRVAAAGEDAMLPVEPELIGEGPTFFMNAIEDQIYATCPTCHGPTEPRTEHLTVLYAPHHVLAVKADCVFCLRCNLLIADQRDVEDRMVQMAKRLPHDPVGADYLAIGTVPWDAWRKDRAHPSDAAWIRATTVPFRKHMLYDAEVEAQIEAEMGEYLKRLAPALEGIGKNPRGLPW